MLMNVRSESQIHRRGGAWVVVEWEVREGGGGVEWKEERRKED